MTCSERLQAELQDDPGGGPPLIPVDPPDPPSSPREQDLTGIPYVHIYSSFYYNHFTLLKCYFTHICIYNMSFFKNKNIKTSVRNEKWYEMCRSSTS